MPHDKSTRYQPQPLVTAGIEIQAELVELVEALARNAHDVWATQRLADEWSWGEKRNDDAKLHPGLVPYDELSESEKDYDRIMVKDTIRAIILLGFRISRNPGD